MTPAITEEGIRGIDNLITVRSEGTAPLVDGAF